MLEICGFPVNMIFFNDEKKKLDFVRTNVSFNNGFFFTGVCTLTRTVGTSADNITFPLTNDREVLLLAQCYKDNPRFALRAIGTSSGITIMSDDDLESIKIVPDRDGGKVYNFIEPLPFKKDFQWNNVNSKRYRI